MEKAQIEYGDKIYRPGEEIPEDLTDEEAEALEAEILQAIAENGNSN
jgi:hypothetical protein